MVRIVFENRVKNIIDLMGNVDLSTLLTVGAQAGLKSDVVMNELKTGIQDGSIKTNTGAGVTTYTTSVEAAVPTTKKAKATKPTEEGGIPEEYIQRYCQTGESGVFGEPTIERIVMGFIEDKFGMEGTFTFKSLTTGLFDIGVTKWSRTQIELFIMDMKSKGRIEELASRAYWGNSYRRFKISTEE